MTTVPDLPRLLIVDDQARNLDVLEAMLDGLGCDLVRAESADEALLALVRHEFAAIVLDIRMPGMDGIELAKLIKQRRRLQHVPILFLTAHLADEREVLQGYGVGAVDYLSKPINPEILRSKVGVFIDLFTKTRELARLNEALQSEIVERERAQAALQQSNEELERRVQARTQGAREAQAHAERQSRLKDEFLANLSHELRTPMNAILGWLSILESGKAVKDIREVLAVIQRNATIQAKLIDDLLDMNRLASGYVRLEIGPVDLQTLLDATLDTLRPSAEAKGVELGAHLSTPLREVPGDSGRLQQVLFNLVQNSIKFSQRGGRVDVRVFDAGGHVRLAVQDDGQGISPDFLPHIFERFSQEDGTATRPASGLGLGLSIAKHLVELHGGRIEASSPGPGQGSTFTILLPRGPVATPRADSGATSGLGAFQA